MTHIDNSKVVGNAGMLGFLNSKIHDEWFDWSFAEYKNKFSIEPEVGQFIKATTADNVETYYMVEDVNSHNDELIRMVKV